MKREECDTIVSWVIGTAFETATNVEYIPLLLSVGGFAVGIGTVLGQLDLVAAAPAFAGILVASHLYNYYSDSGEPSKLGRYVETREINGTEAEHSYGFSCDECGSTSLQEAKLGYTVWYLFGYEVARFRDFANAACWDCDLDEPEIEAEAEKAQV